MLDLAVIQRFLPPDSRGGAGHFTVGLCAALSARGHHVTVFSQDRGPAGAAYRVEQLPGRDRRLAPILFPAQLRAVDFSGFDLVHAQGDEQCIRHAGRPVVRTLHGSSLAEAQSYGFGHFSPKHLLLHAWFYAWELVAVVRADAVVGVSAASGRHVPREIEVIPNGIDPDDLQPVEDLDELRARFAEPHQKLVLLVGRLVYEKGFQLALDALPGLIKRLGDVRFLVAGSGTHEAELRKQAERLGLMEHGTFLGWIGDDVLHSLYRIADLTVVPSLYEPFGLVALEAMASGCPCIVADTGGLREVVPNHDVGLRFKTKSPRSLSHWITRVLTDDELRERLVAEASEHVLRFDWADIAAQTAGLYRRVAAPRPSALRRGAGG